MKSLILGAVVGLALGGMFGYHFLYKSQQKQVGAIYRQISSEQANQGAQKKAAALLQEVQQFKERVSPEADPSWLVQHAATLAREAGVELAAISPENPQSVQSFTRLSVTLSFEAAYHQVGRFLDAIEQSGYFIRVERLTIGAPKDAKGISPVQLTLSTLYAPPTLWGK